MAVVLFFSKFPTKPKQTFDFCLTRTYIRYIITIKEIQKTSPQTVRQHHRTGLIHKRAETLTDIITQFYLIFKRYERFCKVFHRNNYHIESDVSFIMMKHSLVYSFLELGRRIFIISGHQRVRAAKELGIETIMVDIRKYDEEDKVLKDLIETNIR